MEFITMPAKSAKQEKLMRAVCHSKSFAKKVGISTKVGCEMVGENFKPSFTTFLIMDSVVSNTTDAQIDALIEKIETGVELSLEEAKISKSMAAAVYHRDYLKR